MALGLLLGLLAYYFVARTVSRTIEKGTGRPWARYLAIAIFWLIPTWDILPGWMYFSHVCEQEGGQKILKTVELPDEYFFKPGEIVDTQESQLGHAYIAKGGELKLARVRQLFADPSRQEHVSQLLHVDRYTTVLQDKQTSEILATATTVEFYGGWAQNLISEHSPSALCPDDNFKIQGNSLWENTLKRQQSK